MDLFWPTGSMSWFQNFPMMFLACVAGGIRGRLLARFLKEGVQFWYNDTSTVKGGGGRGVRENVLGAF